MFSHGVGRPFPARRNQSFRQNVPEMRELPERFENGGAAVDPDCCGLSWAYGPCFLNETWEKDRLVDSVWKDSARPDGP